MKNRPCGTGGDRMALFRSVPVSLRARRRHGSHYGTGGRARIFSSNFNRINDGSRGGGGAVDVVFVGFCRCEDQHAFGGDRPADRTSNEFQWHRQLEHGGVQQRHQFLLRRSRFRIYTVPWHRPKRHGANSLSLTFDSDDASFSTSGQVDFYFTTDTTTSISSAAGAFD